MINNFKITFWGSSEFSIFCLDELKKQDILPHLIITTSEVPAGRGLKIKDNLVKIWAEQNNISCLSPIKFDNDFIKELSKDNNDIALVASYGKIIPENLINLPKYKTLNIHPSLLPKYRGPSPLQEQILNDEENIGVTIMQIDNIVDHGPIIMQEKIQIANWPIKFEEIEKITAEAGIILFSKILTDYSAGKITPKEQKHEEATFTKKIEKNDGLIDLETDNPYVNYLKYLAYSTWPRTFFFVNKAGKKLRVIIKDAEFNNGLFIIKKVLPEGKKEMSYEDFLRGIK